MPPINSSGKKDSDLLLPNTGESTMRVVPLESCKSLILTHHYSKRLPAAPKLCFADVVYSPVRKTLACVVFSTATGRCMEDMWELTRLVRLPTYDKPLTRLVSKAMGVIRSGKMVDLVCSFADSEEDHHGGIYQACSWVYSGIRGREVDGFNIDGVFVPARTCNQRWGTSSEEGLPKLLLERGEAKTAVPHYDAGKHHYWKALTKDGMRKAIRAGFASNPYPKPMTANGVEANVVFANGHERKGVIDLKAIRGDVVTGNATAKRIIGGQSLLKKK